jgi:hypothetical protein
MLSSKTRLFNLPQRSILTVLLLVLAQGSLFASNVSFIVLESGNAATVAKNAAILWEDGIMEVFFNNGHIISNAKSRKIPEFPKEELPEEALRDFQEADEGGSDYFMVALLNYSNKSDEVAAMPESVTIRLYSVSPYKFIVEKTIVEKKEARTGEKNTTEYELNNAKKLADEIVWYIGRDM